MHQTPPAPTGRRWHRRHRRPDIDPLLAVPALRDADRRHLALLAAHADRVRLPPGHTLARAGDTARELIAVVSGQAAVVAPDGRGAVLHAGAQIGLDEVVGGRRHTATIVTTTEVEAVVLTVPAVLWAEQVGLLGRPTAPTRTREEASWTPSTSRRWSTRTTVSATSR